MSCCDGPIRLSAPTKARPLRFRRMALEWIGQIAPAVAAVGSAAFGLVRGQGRLRSNIRHDAEALKELPSDSPAATALSEHIEWQVKTLRETETEGERNLAMGVWGLFFATVSGYGTVILFAQSGWWRWIASIPLLFTMMMLYVIMDALTVKKRDNEKPKRVHPPSS